MIQEHLDTTIFKGKTYGDLLKDIYVNQSDFDEQINNLIEELSPLIKSVNDAAILAPIVTNYLNTKIKNHEMLVKMTAIVQRTLQTTMATNKALPGIDGLLGDFSMEDIEQLSFELDENKKDIENIKALEQKKKTDLIKKLN